MESYADLDYAEAYFAGRAFSEAWQSCASKQMYLNTASMHIFIYATFPDIEGLDYDLTPPAWLMDATCEQALYLLNLGKDPTQADKKTTLGIVSTDGTVFDKSFAADILSPAAVRLIKTNGGAVSAGAVSSSSAVSVGRIAK